MSAPTTATPYADAAVDYWTAGWHGVLPLPAGAKWPPPGGWTGRVDRDPSYADVWEWSEGPEGRGNVALRMPMDVIGLDVDAYGTKTGGATLAALEARNGALPATWRTTSRDDGTSGIRLYRVPAGLRWPNEAGPGIETVRRAHRYAVVPPSVHPEGRVYRWIGPDGAEVEKPPTPDELPELPTSWVIGLTDARPDDGTVKADLGDPEAEAWIGEHDRGDQPCADMRGDVAAIVEAIVDPTRAAHDALNTPGVGRLIRHAEQGHDGLSVALAEVEAAFVAEVTRPGRAGQRDERSAREEWTRSLVGAVGLVVATPSRTTPEQDPCHVPYLLGREPRNRPAGGPEIDADATNGTGEGDGAGRLPNLPESFWSARPVLTHIRQAAHARGWSADAVLYCVLARVASFVDHRTTIDVGLGPAALNLLVAVVGRSGGGKSAAERVADELTRSYVTGLGEEWRSVPLGSGEGLAEVFMGQRAEPTGRTDKNGNPVMGKPVRRQTHHRAYLWVDEVESLLKQAQRQGSTVFPTLRTAWVGGTLGQSNASPDTTRVVPGGSYALGVAMGVQPGVAGPLFADVGGGTPQRFVWAAATDPSIPDEPEEWPGALSGLALDGYTPAAGHVIGVEHSIRVRVRRASLAQRRAEEGAEDVDPLDAHEPLHLAKLAALLAILAGRRTVTEDDWSLGQTLWSTSCAVRGAVIDHLRGQAREKEQARSDAQVQQVTREAVATEQARMDARMARLAGRVARKVHRAGVEGVKRSDARRDGLDAPDRGSFDEVVEHAVTAGWVIEDDARLRPGSTLPPA